ncbi:MAG: Fic family protein [Alphaproteobacteria bacterium]|nr:Fic family protein [Alphaproteobacteria bacterium]
MKYGVVMQEIRSKIEENSKKLQKLLQNKDNQKVLDKWLKTELAYTSNAIEGNTLTRRETELAIEEQITTGAKPINDYLEARNHANAFDFICEAAKNKVQIDENYMLQIHKIILSGIDDSNAGFYRSVKVRISGSQTILPNPLKVPDLMSDFGKWLLEKDNDVLIKAIEAHYRLVSIHPFVDGNGRTARLLLNSILLENGYAPIIIRKIDRKRYLTALETYQTKENSEPYYKFMLSALNRSLKMMIDLLDVEKVESQDKLLTISKFAKLAELPVSTIRYWMKEGKIRPVMYTPSGYAMFDKSQIDNIKLIDTRRE